MLCEHIGGRANLRAKATFGLANINAEGVGRGSSGTAIRQTTRGLRCDRWNNCGRYYWH